MCSRCKSAKYSECFAHKVLTRCSKVCDEDLPKLNPCICSSANYVHAVELDNLCSFILSPVAHLLPYLLSLFISSSEYKHVLGLPPSAAGPLQHAIIVIGIHASMRSGCDISATKPSDWGYALCPKSVVTLRCIRSFAAI